MSRVAQRATVGRPDVPGASPGSLESRTPAQMSTVQHGHFTPSRGPLDFAGPGASTI